MGGADANADPASSDPDAPAEAKAKGEVLPPRPNSFLFTMRHDPVAGPHHACGPDFVCFQGALKPLRPVTVSA